jgi:UDP-N-acetylmuramoylalanine--D-glutamate ligase
MYSASLHTSRMELTGRRIGVIGLARSGLACVRFLLREGAQVVGADAKAREQLEDPYAQVTSLGGEFVAGFRALDQLGGPDLLVISPGVPISSPALEEARARGIEVIGELELAYRFFQAPMLAVTGTNGKGSTVTMAGKMLEAAGIKHLVAGNIGLPLISQVERTAEVEVVVAEVSSFQLESIRYFRPWQACLLNITPDHLDRHGSAEAYIAAKRRLFENQQSGDYAIICLDDPLAAAQTDATRARLLTVSTQTAEANGRLEGDDLVVEVDGPPRIICTRADMPVPGLHQVRNALCAALMATVCGAPAVWIAEGLRHFRAADHLLQVVCEAEGVTYLDDSKATNPAAAAADLQSLAPPVIVIAGGQGKGSDFAVYGDVLARRAKLVLLIGECKGEIAAAVGDRTAVRLCASLEEAVTEARRAAAPGDKVALIPAAASFDMFRDQAQRGERFAQLCRASS